MMAASRKRLRRSTLRSVCVAAFHAKIASGRPNAASVKLARDARYADVWVAASAALRSAAAAASSRAASICSIQAVVATSTSADTPSAST